jgi:hypothetical protein
VESEIVEFSSEVFTLKGVLTRGKSSIGNGALILHPHPLYGGDMGNPVVLALENELLKAGYTTLRFDFRGTSSSPQGYSGVTGAVVDVSNAVNLLMSRDIHEYGIAGYSFGGSTALRHATESAPLFLITLSASFGLVSEGVFDTTQLSKVKCPTLMFHGQSDRMVPPADIETMSKLLGSDVIETVCLEGEGHFYQRSLERVMDKVSTFLVKFSA